MKLALGLLGVLGTSMLIGCGTPGLGHHGAYVKGPSDAVGTAELTSAESFQLPNERGSLSEARATNGMQAAPLFLDPWEEQAEKEYAKVQTWGAPPAPEDRYGF